MNCEFLNLLEFLIVESFKVDCFFLQGFPINIEVAGGAILKSAKMILTGVVRVFAAGKEREHASGSAILLRFVASSSSGVSLNVGGDGACSQGRPIHYFPMKIASGLNRIAKHVAGACWGSCLNQRE